MVVRVALKDGVPVLLELTDIVVVVVGGGELVGEVVTVNGGVRVTEALPDVEEDGVVVTETVALTVACGVCVGEGVVRDKMLRPWKVKLATSPPAISQAGYAEARTPELMRDEGMSCVTLPTGKQAAVLPPRRICTLSKT